MWAALRLLLAAALVAVPLWLALTRPVYACTFAAPPLEDQVRAADAIVIGTGRESRLIMATTLEPLPTPGGEPVSLGPGEKPIVVEEYLKGSGPSAISIYQAALYAIPVSGGGTMLSPLLTDCELFIGASNRYLLFLTTRDDGRYDTSLFSGSARLDADTEQYLARVRDVLARDSLPPGLPNSGAGPPAQQTSSQWLVPLAAGGAGLLASSAFLALSRRRPR